MIAILVAVQIIAGSSPETSTSIAGIYTPNECDKMAVMRNNGPPRQNDPEGRPVIMREFKCMLVDSSDVVTMNELLAQ